MATAGNLLLLLTLTASANVLAVSVLSSICEGRFSTRRLLIATTAVAVLMCGLAWIV